MTTKLITRFLVLFLIGWLFSGCTGSSGPVSPIGDFPLTKGTTWTYAVTEYQPAQNDPSKTITAHSTYKDTVVDTQTAGSYFIAHVQRTSTLLSSDPGWIASAGAGITEWWYVLDDLKIYES